VRRERSIKQVAEREAGREVGDAELDGLGRVGLEPAVPRRAQPAHRPAARARRRLSAPSPGRVPCGLAQDISVDGRFIPEDSKRVEAVGERGARGAERGRVRRVRVRRLAPAPARAAARRLRGGRGGRARDARRFPKRVFAIMEDGADGIMAELLAGDVKGRRVAARAH
jgi:hypothetical protein